MAANLIGWVLESELPPNPRVQRTRPYASLRGSPLTRHPLGGPWEHSARGAAWPAARQQAPQPAAFQRSCGTGEMIGVS